MARHTHMPHCPPVPTAIDHLWRSGDRQIVYQLSVASQNRPLTTSSTAAHYIDHHPKLASSKLDHWPEHGSNRLSWIYETIIYESKRRQPTDTARLTHVVVDHRPLSSQRPGWHQPHPVASATPSDHSEVSPAASQRRLRQSQKVVLARSYHPHPPLQPGPRDHLSSSRPESRSPNNNNNKTLFRGFAKKTKSKNPRLPGKWVGGSRSHSEFFLVENRPKIALTSANILE